MRTTIEDFKEAIDNATDSDVTKWIGEGWDLFKKNAGSLIGYIFVQWAIAFGMAMLIWATLFGIVVSSFQSEPGVGMIILVIVLYLVVMAVFVLLMAGNYSFLKVAAREGNASFGEFFGSFKYAGNLLLATLITAIISWIFQAGQLSAQLGMYGELLAGHTDPASLSQYNNGFTVWSGISLVGSIGIGISYMFVQPLIISNEINFWVAMEVSRRAAWKRFLPLFGFIILIVLINIAGAFLCLLGLFVTIPLSYCCIQVAHDKVFNQGLTQMESSIQDFGAANVDSNFEGGEEI